MHKRKNSSNKSQKTIPSFLPDFVSKGITSHLKGSNIRINKNDSSIINFTDKDGGSCKMKIILGFKPKNVSFKEIEFLPQYIASVYKGRLIFFENYGKGIFS